MNAFKLLAILSLTLVPGPLLGFNFVYTIENNEVTVRGISGNPVDIPDIITVPDTIEGFPVVHIADHAFDSFQFLEEVVLPDSVRTIGSNVFPQTSGLLFGEGFRRVNIPTQLEILGERAFYSCRDLEGSISLPPSCTQIGKEAFRDCYNLDAITIQAPITSIPEGIVRNCRSLDVFIIPDSVTTIGDFAFENTSLDAIELPPSLVSIGDYAYADLRNISQITIPRTVQTIGDYAFKSCQELEEVQFLGNTFAPSQLQSLGKFAFSYCFELTRINLPPNLQTIENGTFISCRKLDPTPLPPTLSTIGDFAFVGCRFEEIIIPSTVQNLGERAFEANNAARKIQFQGNLAQIPERCFNLCRSILSIELPANTTEIGPLAFWGGRSVQNVTLPETLEICGPSAFASAIELESVTFGPNLTTIGTRAFQDCPQLSEIRFLGPAPTTVEDFAFSSVAPGAKALVLDEHVASYGGVGALWNGLLVETHIPAVDPSLLSYVIVFDQVLITDCDTSALGTLQIPETIEGFPVTAIGDNAFLGCTEIDHIILPESVFQLGNFCFYSCTSLQSINLPEAITRIPSYAFGFCSSLVELDLPSQLEEIDDFAFAGCENLSAITVPATIETLGSQAFLDNEQLQSVRFLGPPPATVGPSPFFRVSSEATLFVAANHVAAFGGVGATWKGLPVTLSGAELFPSVLNWEVVDGTFIRILGCDNSASGNLTVPSELAGLPVLEIAEAAFSNCSLLNSLILPDSIKQIDRDAFSSCTSLSSITLPSNLLTLGSGAFLQCSALTSLVLPESLGSIANSTFRGCSALTSITLPSGLTSINTEAFRDCVSLPAITLPDTLVSLRIQVFSGCSSLTEIIFDGTAPSSVGSQPFLNVNAQATVRVYPENAASFGGVGATWETLPVALRDPRSFQVLSTAGENGSVTGSGSYPEGDFATLEATAEEGFRFLRWQGDDVSDFNPLVIIVESDVTIDPVFIRQEDYDAAFESGRSAGEFVCQQAIAADPSAFGYFTADQIHQMSVAPALARQADGSFLLEICVQTASDLSAFAPFDFSGSTPMIDENGKLVIPFESDGPAAFFQLSFDD